MSTFQLLRQINALENRSCLATRRSADEVCFPLFPGDPLQDRFARALCARSAAPLE